VNKFYGYIRKNGQVGIRNKIIILPTVICANSVALAISNKLPEVIAIPHVNGCTLDPKNNNDGKNEELTLIECILAGYKFALGKINIGDDVIKYGHSIGRIFKQVKRGELVHIHNLESKRGKDL